MVFWLDGVYIWISSLLCLLTRTVVLGEGRRVEYHERGGKVPWMEKHFNDLVGAVISSVTQTLSLSEEVFQTVNH